MSFTVGYASAYKFAVVPNPRGRSAPGGVYDRVGMVKGLQALGATVSVITPVAKHTQAWLQAHQIGYAPQGTQHYDLLIVECFAWSPWAREDFRRVYNILARFEGPVVYYQFDQDFYLSLEQKTVTRWTGVEYRQDDLTEGKTYFIAVPCERPKVFIEKALHPKRLAEAAWQVVPYNLHSFGPRRWTSPRPWPARPGLVFCGKESSYRRKRLPAYATADPGLPWDLYGRWKPGLPANVAVSPWIWQMQVLPTLREYWGSLLLPRDQFQVDAHWHLHRDCETFQAGIATFVPQDHTLITGRPGFDPDWAVASPADFGARVRRLLEHPKRRFELAWAQYAWAQGFAPEEHQGAKDVLDVLRPYLP